MEYKLFYGSTALLAMSAVSSYVATELSSVLHTVVCIKVVPSGSRWVAFLYYSLG